MPAELLAKVAIFYRHPFCYDADQMSPNTKFFATVEVVQASSQIFARAIVSAVTLWCAQPPLAWWPLAFFAIIPWLDLIATRASIPRRGWWIIYGVSLAYWLMTLQGLRFAHPLMFLCWFALSAYLAVYHVGFVAITRRLLRNRVPLIIAAPTVWVAAECVRNYLLTGISAAMLGHTMADVPWMIQIADLGGTYIVGFVVVTANVALFTSLRLRSGMQSRRSNRISVLASLLLLAATIGYGIFRTSQPTDQSLATFALLQRDEVVEYEQSQDREVEMFQAYGRQAIAAIANPGQRVDAVVWPESMFTGGVPLVLISEGATMPSQYADIYPEAVGDPSWLRSMVDQQRSYFDRRGDELQAVLRSQLKGPAPAILAGCGVVNYDDAMNVYSGVVWMDDDGDVVDWYGKTHLVMFGEYIPVAPWIPGLRSLIPPGMGIQTGSGGKVWNVNGTAVAPNICIETAVERILVNQMRSFRKQSQSPDVVVTVTNDGWFDNSSIIEHHLRCAQLVAVGIRRPILSSANNGPTASIDSTGRVVARLKTGVNSTLMATPRRDTRSSVYVRVGSMPAWACVVIVTVLSFYRRRRE